LDRLAPWACPEPAMVDNLTLVTALESLTAEDQELVHTAFYGRGLRRGDHYGKLKKVLAKLRRKLTKVRY
jgi:hypothetical protein